MYRDWQDCFGLVHNKKFPSLRDSENTPLFASATELIMQMNNTDFMDMLPAKFEVFINKGFNTYPEGEDGRFSHDNMTGMYIAKRLGYLKDIKLPIMEWRSNTREGEFERDYWLHPRDIIFYLTLSGNILGQIMLPLLLLISIPSFFGTGTSGKCLWFYRFNTLIYRGSLFEKMIGKMGMFIAHHLLKMTGWGNEPYKKVFSRYFVKNHPINQEIFKYYTRRKYARQTSTGI